MFHVVVPTFNAAKYTSVCIERLRSQTLINFRAYIVDDASTDGTQGVIASGVGDDDRFTTHRNRRNLGALHNIATAINAIKAPDEDVVCLVDGDDYLLHNEVLAVVNDRYERDRCVMTYGTMLDSHGELYRSHRLTPDVIAQNDYRRRPWGYCPLRTFKLGVWRAIPQDTHLKWRRSYFRETYDQAIVFCLLELAGGRASYIEEPLYKLGWVGRSDVNAQEIYRQAVINLPPLSPRSWP